MPPKNKTVGAQDMPTQNIQLWHIDYFDLWALEKQQMQKGAFSDLPLSA